VARLKDMKNNILLLLVFSLSIFSCSNLSKNLVKKGTLVFHSGKAQDRVWDDDLNFYRLSWFKELTLYFDVLYVKLDQSSPFTNWLSATEKDFLVKCKEPWIILTYAHDSDLISPSMFFEQIERKGFTKYVLNDFSRSLKMHPDYEKMSLVLHKVHGLCGEGNFLSNEVNFPGFETVAL
jgi:hypothetical protein